MTGVNIAQPDITLVLDNDGVIRDASVSALIPERGLSGWLGRLWTETVDPPVGDQVRRMLEDARRNGVSAFREVTQRFPSGLELPIEYTTVRLGGSAGLLAVGKNLQAYAELKSRLVAAQQAREHDYWKLRDIETRSRLLFDASSEAVLLVSAEQLKVVEANPAAIRSLGISPGWEILREVAPADHAALQGMLQRARESGRTPGILVHLGAAQAPWTVRASLMTPEPGPVFLLQLSPAGPARREASAIPAAVPLAQILERLPDAFLVMDRQGLVLQANTAFLDLIQAGAPGVAVGQSLGRWLQEPGSNLEVLLASLSRNGAVRLFPATITGEFGTRTEVEISAAGGGGLDPQAIGVVLRDVSRRLASAEPGQDLRQALEGISTSIGHNSLPELVRNTSAIVERFCIEAALQQSGGNRRIAAEILGLSRQSLYAKLNRYGLERGGGDSE